MSVGRKHRRQRGGSKFVRLDLSQLVDFDRDIELIAVVKDLETDDVLKEITLGGLIANKPVLVSLRAKFLPGASE